MSDEKNKTEQEQEKSDELTTENLEHIAAGGSVVSPRDPADGLPTGK